jgi:phage-related protein
MGSTDDHERFGVDTADPLEFKDDPGGSWTSPTYGSIPTSQDDLCATDYKEAIANAGRVDVWDTRSRCSDFV